MHQEDYKNFMQLVKETYFDRPKKTESWYKAKCECGFEADVRGKGNKNDICPNCKRELNWEQIR